MVERDKLWLDWLACRARKLNVARVPPRCRYYYDYDCCLEVELLGLPLGDIEICKPLIWRMTRGVGLGEDGVRVMGRKLRCWNE
jgi:hypothetical protein